MFQFRSYVVGSFLRKPKKFRDTQFLFKANAICALNIIDPYKNIYSIRNYPLKQCNAREKEEIE